MMLQKRRVDVRRLGLMLIGAAMLGVVGIVFVFLYLKADLPTIQTLADYHPPEATKIYSDDGFLVGCLATERRSVVPIDAIPKHVVHAFLAAEDADFYEHEGLDYFGILRAAVKNLRPGAHRQGASTITQQTVKTLVLGPERSYARKIREAILSRELEEMLTKDEILHLYLNQIYFGSGAYGVEEAAQTYFGKSIRTVTLGEAALLASIPKNPSRYTPRRDPVAAKGRQAYVLQQMLAKGWTDAAGVEKALAEPVVASPPAPTYLGTAPHYVEQIRRQLVDRYGEQAVYNGGLTVYAGLNAVQQVAAHKHLRRGLEALAKRQGYPGAPLRIEVDRFARYHKILVAEFSERVAHAAAFVGQENIQWLWDLSTLDPQNLRDDTTVKGHVTLTPLEPGTRVRGLVVKVDSVEDTVEVDLGCCTGRIKLDAIAWARRFAPGIQTSSPRDPSEVVRQGDLIDVEVSKVVSDPQEEAAEGRTNTMPNNDSRTELSVDLIPEVKVEGALVAIDPHTRLVRSLVGGYDMSPEGFNRATQALRQPGSAFKPIVYATGLNEGAITPASTCPDTPIVIRDPWTGRAWKPENYEDGRYDGNITYRTALMRSKNTCSVKLVERMGPEGPAKVIEMARALGIHSALPNNLTLALGTGEVTPLELCNAYATIAAGGLLAEPLFVRKVVDRHGAVLEESQALPTEALKPSVAYVLTSMMKSVVEGGTATRALALDRPLAGKTGTTNESRSVWFSGFSAELVATVWVGFDDNNSLGRVTGSSGALPIWIGFMGDALANNPRREFTPPPDVVFLHVDANTGAPSDDVGSIEEAFIAGTEPTEEKRPLPSIFIQDEPL